MKKVAGIAAGTGRDGEGATNARLTLTCDQVNASEQFSVNVVTRDRHGFANNQKDVNMKIVQLGLNGSSYLKEKSVYTVVASDQTVTLTAAGTPFPSAGSYSITVSHNGTAIATFPVAVNKRECQANAHSPDDTTCRCKDVGCCCGG